MDVFLFIAAMLSMIATVAIVCIMCKHAKLKALITGIAFQSIKGTDAIFSSINESDNCTCKAQWYTIAYGKCLIVIYLISVLKYTIKLNRKFIL